MVVIPTLDEGPTVAHSVPQAVTTISLALMQTLEYRKMIGYWLVLPKTFQVIRAWRKSTETHQTAISKGLDQRSKLEDLLQ